MPEETIGQIAARDLSKAVIFNKYGLDFCCGGKKTVKQACAEKGLDAATVEKELEYAEGLPVSSSLRYNEWSLDVLADFIVNQHHAYVKESLPVLVQKANRVMKVHGREHPELVPVYELVEAVKAELEAHMIKEERVLFPYIKSLVKAANGMEAPPTAHFGSVINPINMMEHEHETVGKNLEQIRHLTSDYTLPADACGSYSFLYRLLDQFEKDLHIHVHLENNILFPKALEIEKSFCQCPI